MPVEKDVCATNIENPEAVVGGGERANASCHSLFSSMINRSGEGPTKIKNKKEGAPDTKSAHNAGFRAINCPRRFPTFTAGTQNKGRC